VLFEGEIGKVFHGDEGRCAFQRRKGAHLRPILHFLEPLETKGKRGR
jgi:hypothetical protein